jgi:NAD(P)-dependent dehydrogenase (short-subunit alcohol dehydrogenase family)
MMKKVCIVGVSGKLGQYMVQHALDRGYEVVGVCREQSVGKLDAFKGRITVIPGATNDREVILGGFSSTRRERPRRSSTTRVRARASFSPVAGISRGTARTYTRGASGC